MADSLGRRWQLGSIQLDYQLPERFELDYVDSCGNHPRPMIVHRAMFGSFERFIGILIEHFDGHLPPWLSPEAVRILPISLDERPYAESIAAKLNGARASVDDDGPLSVRIARADQARIPLQLIVGKRERERESVSARLERGRQLSLSVEAAVKQILESISDRKMAYDIVD